MRPNPDFNPQPSATEIFDDPVEYLAGLGIVAELVTESVLPVAA